MNKLPKCTILVVDDEPSICWGFERLLSDLGHKVLTASSAEEGLEKAAAEQIDLLLLDVRLPGEDGISALPRFRHAIGDAPVVVMTAFGDLETAVAAIHGGASDYLTKPFKLEDASRVCQAMLRQGQQKQLQDFDTTEQGPVDAAVLVGRSAAMQQVFRRIALVADSELSVLITGETGTGKELVAAAIHRHSRRHSASYVAIAPVSLSESVVESELFGHVKGAFTGAAETRKGLFELADGGTVLLDEIGDLPMATQVKLLRVIEQGEFTAVGDLRARKCDVRVIAATNRDLRQGVDESTFREDLLYRLSAVAIELPPLRKRRDDIPILCEYFLRRLGYPSVATAISGALMQQLQGRDWFGNVRELRNAVEHASVMARGRVFELADFPVPQQRSRSAGGDDAQALDALVEQWTRDQLSTVGIASLTDLHDRLINATEPALLRVVLEHTAGNRAAAAQLLGMHRGTLRDRLKRYESDSGE
ncbi:sigma-54 dependent transcriptional regulator [bacterium]|nr:sigma-54 dependent transcriptional regulator [Rubripirellula sp.]MDB4393927.1 sigma-54 dependent transcriptional regulator [Rhodopirellula sp.]MDB4561369.1 sigma-54 dependent transcriptional regulator [bacterium]MDB4621405.1 sigma-54 dependent transcriptional regulator [Rubripirellula sp.]